MQTKVGVSFTGHGNTSKSPAFAYKIYHILESETYTQIICWSPEGNTFVVKDPNNFSE